jgi:hypothetical protein
MLPVWCLPVWIPCCGWQLQGDDVSVSRRAMRQQHQVRAAVGYWCPLRKHGERAAVLVAESYARVLMVLMVNVCM